MGQPNRITVKELMERYAISARTAVRWRQRLRRAGLLVGTSPKAYSLFGDWTLIDQAVQVGTLRQQ